MGAAPLHRQESERLDALKSYRVLDTSPEKGFDDVTYLAAALCKTPIAVISFVDKDRQWFKSRIGIDLHQTSRSISFCAHTILQQTLFVVPDATLDPRFAENPLVTGRPDIRFYAGVPVFSSDGLPLGALSVSDREPRTLAVGQEESLRALARLVRSLLELRKIRGELASAQDALNLFGAVLPICSSCGKMKSEKGDWMSLNTYVQTHARDESQGVCPDCAKKLYPDYIRG